MVGLCEKYSYICIRVLSGIHVSTFWTFTKSNLNDDSYLTNK